MRTMLGLINLTQKAQKNIKNIELNDLSLQKIIHLNSKPNRLREICLSVVTVW